jgi:hypothetical protein
VIDVLSELDRDRIGRRAIREGWQLSDDQTKLWTTFHT